MYTSVNKKMKMMIGTLIFSSLLIMMVSPNSPRFLVYITMFTNMIFNIFFSFLFVVGCYAMLRKYEEEFSIREIGMLAFTSFLLMVISFITSHSVLDQGSIELVQPEIWVCFIDIIVICCFFIFKKMNYHLSLTKTFLCYYVLTIGFAILFENVSATMMRMIMISWMQLGMLFWVEEFIHEKKYQWYEWFVLIGLIVSMAYLCIGWKITLLNIPLIHICILFYLSVMKQWFGDKQMQLVNIGALLIIFLSFQFIGSQEWDLFQYISILILQLQVFLMSITLYIVEHNYPIKPLLCTYALMLVGMPFVYHNIFVMDVMFCMMQVLALALLLWMYKKQMKLTYIAGSCIGCMVIMFLVLTAMRNLY